jgi:two-component system cell cycle response regulator
MHAKKTPTATGATAACTWFILITLAALLFALQHEYTARKLAREQQVSNASLQLTEQFNGALRDIDLSFNLMDNTPWVTRALNANQPAELALQRHLRASLQRIPLLGKIQLVDPACRVVLDTADENPPALLQSNLCFWLHNQGRRVNRYFTELNGSDHDSDIVHAFRLQDPQHNTVGMAIATLRQASVISAMRDMNIGTQGEIWIQDRHEHLLFYSPGLRGQISTIQRNDIKFAQLLSELHQQTLYSRSPLDGQSRLYSVRTLDSVPLQVAVGRSPLDDARSFSTSMAVYTAIWLLLTALALLMTRRQLHHIRQTERLLDNARRLHVSENQIEQLLDSIPIAALLIEPQQLLIRYANPHAQALLRLDGASGTLPELDDRSSELSFDFEPLAQWLQSGRDTYSEEVEITAMDHIGQWVLASIHPISLRGESLSLLTLQDRNELKSQAQALQDKTLQLDALLGTDPLTQLQNRYAAQQALRHEINRCQRYGQPMSLICFDLDHFRGFNQRHGHEAGDQVLQAVARELKASTRATDLCARIGGEEFMVIFTNTPLTHAYKVMERIREKMARTILPMTEESVSFSGGMTGWQLGDTPEEMELRADRLLQHAKNSGRNCLLTDQDVL